MNPYNLDPRNMTAEERERAAYLAGDYATANEINDRMDSDESVADLLQQTHNMTGEVCDLHEEIEELQVEIESLRAAADMIDE